MSLVAATRFSGFTLPDGAWLPPELVYLLPHLSEAKLKVLVAIIYHNLQVGGSEPCSLTDLENMTGLARSTVNNATQELLADELVEREKVGRSYTYRPKVRNSYHKLSQLRESDSKLKTPLSDSLDSPDIGTKFVLLIKDLRAAGVYLKTAQAMIAQHDEATIRRHLDYYRYALQKGFAQGPGWLVLSVKESWPAPLGFEDHSQERRSCPDCGGPQYNGSFLHNAGCPTFESLGAPHD